MTRKQLELGKTVFSSNWLSSPESQTTVSWCIVGLISSSTKLLIGLVIYEWAAAIGVPIIGFRDNLELCRMNATIEASQKANKIRGDKSTVNRHKPFASVNYTKMISILVLKCDFTIWQLVMQMSKCPKSLNPVRWQKSWTKVFIHGQDFNVRIGFQLAKVFSFYFFNQFLKFFFLLFSEGKVGSAKGIRLSVLSVWDFTQSNFCGRNSILSNRFGALNRLFFINGFQGFVVSVIKVFLQ